MMINQMMRNVQEEKPEIVKETIGKETVISDTSETKCDKIGFDMLLTLIISHLIQPKTIEPNEIKECYHNLEKRLCVLEKLVECLMKKGLE